MAHSPTQWRDTGAARWGRRLGWLILIWATSVLALAVVVYAFRLVMTSVGVTR